MNSLPGRLESGAYLIYDFEGDLFFSSAPGGGSIATFFGSLFNFPGGRFLSLAGRRFSTFLGRNKLRFLQSRFELLLELGLSLPGKQHPRPDRRSRKKLHGLALKFNLDLHRFRRDVEYFVITLAPSPGNRPRREMRILFDMLFNRLRPGGRQGRVNRKLVDPTSAADAASRESIEVRALVLACEHRSLIGSPPNWIDAMIWKFSGTSPPTATNAAWRQILGAAPRSHFISARSRRRSTSATESQIGIDSTHLSHRMTKAAASL
jgi:hypothetical protein